MSNASRFQFIKSQHVPTLTVLHAAIEGFSYDRHAHEEYAFGATLAGRQDFFSGGQFHRSPYRATLFCSIQRKFTTANRAESAH